MRSETLHELVDFNVDRYTNPYIPRNRLDILPDAVSRFLGHRRTVPMEPSSALQWLVTFPATVAGICLVGGIFTHAPGIADLHPPNLIASLGASAILFYNAVRSPLAQPRNAVLGHTLSAIVGVAISKLFQLSPSFPGIEWVAAAVACACASLVMSITNTVHPPGGATAVLASTDRPILAIGWLFPALILLATALMTAVACLFDNLLRQYPVFWWTADECGQRWPRRRNERHDNDGGEKSAASDLEAAMAKTIDSSPSSSSSSDDDSTGSTLRREWTGNVDFLDGLDAVRVSSHQIQLPAHVVLSDEDVSCLERLQRQLRTHAAEE